MAKQNKIKFLATLKELVDYIVSLESAEFTALHNICRVDVDEETVRESRVRDLHREAEHHEHPLEGKKHELLNFLAILCPEMTSILVKLEQSFWNDEQKIRALPGTVMIANDWKEFYEFCRSLMQ